MQAAVGVGARVHPGAEHGADRTPELLLGRLRERGAGLALHQVLVALDHLGPVLGGECGVLERVELGLHVLDDLFEAVVRDAQHHRAVHLDEAAVAVPGEARVAGRGLQAPHGRVVEAEVEHGVHHARHRDPGAGAHRDQQRPLLVAEREPDRGLDVRQRRLDLGVEVGRIAPLVAVELGAEIGGDGEARRHRQADPGHLGQVGALAAEQVAEVGAALVAAGAEAVDPLRHEPSLRFGTEPAAAGEPRAGPPTPPPIRRPYTTARRHERTTTPARGAVA